MASTATIERRFSEQEGNVLAARSPVNFNFGDLLNSIGAKFNPKPSFINYFDPHHMELESHRVPLLRNLSLKSDAAHLLREEQALQPEQDKLHKYATMYQKYLSNGALGMPLFKPGVPLGRDEAIASAKEILRMGNADHRLVMLTKRGNRDNWQIRASPGEVIMADVEYMAEQLEKGLMAFLWLPKAT